MRVQTEEWRRFIPGVRMYKGKMTLFWNGQILCDRDTGEFLIYNWEERKTWEVIMVLPGVEAIPEGTFSHCENVKTVIMADTVRRIEYQAFQICYSLEYVRLSRNLEYIGDFAFKFSSLTSIFIPTSCTEIGHDAFANCKLIILSVPQHTQLGENVIACTPLIEKSHSETNHLGYYQNLDEVNQWIKNINQGEIYSLHRACSAVNPPLENDIVATMRRQGLGALREPNSIGVTPLQYLEANPYAEIDEEKIMKKYILEMMGEIV